MGWYQVVKSIKGHQYLYAQRTWREGKHVRTESRHVIHAGEPLLAVIARVRCIIVLYVIRDRSKIKLLSCSR